MDLTIFLLTSVCIWVVYLFWKGSNSNSKLPPGPKGIPIFGNMLSLKSEPAQKLVSFSKTFGSIFTIYLGSKPCIVICDYADIKDMMNLKETAGRQYKGICTEISQGMGLVFSVGELWKSSKKLLLQYLRDSSKGHMESVVSEELKNIVATLKEHADKNKVIDVTHYLHQSACNVTFYLLFGKLFDYDDPVFVENVERLRRNFYLFLKLQSLSVLKPWINPFLYCDEKEVLENSKNFRIMLTSIADELKECEVKDLDSNLVHRFFSASEKEKEEIHENKLFSDKQLTEMMVDLFGAGTETLATTIRWLILYMLEYPEIRIKMQNEIDEVVGSRLPTLEDRSKLPYTNACLQELERISSVAHLAVMHTSTCDFEWKGFTIPKDTDILYNIWAVHHDPKIWENPHEFNPDRFIGESGEVFRPDYLVPFGIGRRACPGEMLGKVEIFLYATTLFHYFDFEKVKGEPDVHSPSVTGLTREPPNYKIEISLRSKHQ